MADTSLRQRHSPSRPPKRSSLPTGHHHPTTPTTSEAPPRTVIPVQEAGVSSQTSSAITSLGEWRSSPIRPKDGGDPFVSSTQSEDCVIEPKTTHWLEKLTEYDRKMAPSTHQKLSKQITTLFVNHYLFVITSTTILLIAQLGYLTYKVGNHLNWSLDVEPNDNNTLAQREPLGFLAHLESPRERASPDRFFVLKVAIPSLVSAMTAFIWFVSRFKKPTPLEEISKKSEYVQNKIMCVLMQQTIECSVLKKDELGGIANKVQAEINKTNVRMSNEKIAEAMQAVWHQPKDHEKRRPVRQHCSLDWESSDGLSPSSDSDRDDVRIQMNFPQ